MYYPSGFGFGSHFLLYIGVPLIIGIWAQIRVTSAFRKWGEVPASSNITGAESAHGDRTGDNGRVANAALRDSGWIVLSHYRLDHTRHLLLCGSTGLPNNHAPGGIRCLAAGKNHFATDGHRSVRGGSCWREQGPQRSCAHVRSGIHRCAGELALADVDPRSAVIDCTMDPALALPARRISDLLSSGLEARAKSRHETMDQPRVDPDQELVKRTQSGDAGAFDELVIKYSPRLYGLVYNMTSNHEDTNDLLQDIFAKAYRAIRGFRGKSSFYTWIHSIAVNMTLNFLKKRGRRFQLSLDDVDASIQNDKEFLESTATSSPVREADLSELQRRLNEAMMKLSDEHRAVVTMFHIQGMPHAEISKILRVSEGTVRSRLFYANRQLQNFLHEFHRRQRDEMLRQPLWRICLERAHALMLRLDVRSLASYPAAVAAVLVCAAVISLKIYQQPETARVALQSPPALSAPARTEGEWSLTSPVATQIFRTQPVRNFNGSAQTHRAAAPPRYVLDSVPVSYEPTFRF